MPKADATGLAPEKSATRTLRHFIVPEGSLFVIRLGVFPISLVESPSGGLGHKTRRFARRALQILRFLLGWDTAVCLHGQVSYPTRWQLRCLRSPVRLGHEI